MLMRVMRASQELLGRLDRQYNLKAPVEPSVALPHCFERCAEGLLYNKMEIITCLSALGHSADLEPSVTLTLTPIVS